MMNDKWFALEWCRKNGKLILVWPDDTPLKNVVMSVRAWNSLTRNWKARDDSPYPKKLKTVGDVRRIPPVYFLLNIRNLGVKTLKEIQSFAPFNEFSVAPSGDSLPQKSDSRIKNTKPPVSALQAQDSTRCPQKPRRHPENVRPGTSATSP